MSDSKASKALMWYSTKDLSYLKTVDKPTVPSKTESSPHQQQVLDKLTKMEADIALLTQAVSKLVVAYVALRDKIDGKS